MRKMTSREIRDMWLKYFNERGHLIVPSANLIPKDDDTLLWINAGVTPLKRYFDGSEVPVSKRITNIQKCIRTNDIENVGVTRRHHTFFEMMGNFSIGDYFKEEAIEFAYNLLTGEDWFNIPNEKLYVTVFPDDIDTINKWESMGIDSTHIIKLSDNFWEIGPGPCGPDTEIFFDRGPKYDPEGDALEKFKKGDDNERFVEIWNNVFSQFNSEEGKERSEYKELPSKNIDTGAGLERWACIFQDADSNFDTDLFMPIINAIEEMSGVIYNGEMEFKVIADHIRALTFALADGATFENYGRGYILRRLLRRSVRMGRKLGLSGLFIYKLVDVVVRNMQDVYPYLNEKIVHVKTLIMQEEELFGKTLKDGEKKLYELMDESLNNKISGADAFKLYDTYGFPFELTLEYLQEKGFTTDRKEFDEYMAKQKELSKSNVHHENAMNTQNELLLKYMEPSEFVYDKYRMKSNIIALISDDKLVDKITKEGYIILDKTCFYATGGGQVNDTGMIIGDAFKARVIDVFKAPNGQNVHKIKVLSGVVKPLEVELVIDEDRRKKIECNHSSVHLLQYSLRTLIDKTIAQNGSRVDDLTLRFDFTTSTKITDDMLISVEEKVNKMIKEKIKRVTTLKSINDIDKSEVMALFNEKYGDVVRLVEFNGSKELCGGTHVKNTSDIKVFSILSFESKGSNVYRIEAATGDNLEKELMLFSKKYIDDIVKLTIKAKSIVQEADNEHIKLGYKVKDISDKVTSYKDIVRLKNELAILVDEVKTLEKEYTKVKEDKLVKSLSNLKDDVISINNSNLLLKKVDNMNVNSLKQVMDNLVNEYQNIFIMLANVTSDNINLLARSNNPKLNAGVILKDAATKCLGNGGGSPTFAQGAGKDISKLDEIFETIKKDITNE